MTSTATVTRYHGHNYRLNTEGVSADPIHRLIAGQISEYHSTLRLLAATAEKLAGEAAAVSLAADQGAGGEVCDVLHAPYSAALGVVNYTAQATTQRQAIARLLHAAGLI